MIIWAGTSNKDVGMVIEHYPTVVFPERNQEIQRVPGRNGDIVLTNGSFKNYTQQYSAFLDSKKFGGLQQTMPKVANWLLGNEGYHRLEDSYFPDFYRMAYYSGGVEFLSVFNEYGRGVLSFVCAPEKFYKSGEKSFMLENGQILLNPSSFDAYPWMRIRGEGAGELMFTHFYSYIDERDGQKKERVENTSIIITDIGTVIGIDVKLHKAYYNDENRSDRISGKFEDLKLGRKTQILWSSNITSIEFKPRWWTI